jgi:hypothetical protein
VLPGIDPGSWQIALLPHPKRFSRSKALGFCGGVAVGVAETARAKVAACWWPGSEPELLVLDGYSDLKVLFARGDTIPGSWSKKHGSSVGAAAWRFAGGVLEGRDLHDARFERTWAEGAGGGLIVGVGVHKGKLGARPKDSGLVWDTAGSLREITAEDDVCLRATDGTGVAGNIGVRAVLWPSFGAPAVELAPKDMPASEVYAIDGDRQIGYAFKKLAARAVVWQGTAASAVDLTPDGFEESRAFDGAHGYQVGLVRERSTTRNGSSACDDRAAIWQGAADRWFDLNALLPKPFNSSNAWALHVTGDRILICGEARQVETSDAGTPRESHYVPAAQAVLWTATIA